MKIATSVLQQINTQSVRMKISLALGSGEGVVIRSIKNNKPNNKLTTATALKIIREETGLKDRDILTDLN